MSTSIGTSFESLKKKHFRSSPLSELLKTGIECHLTHQSEHNTERSLQHNTPRGE